MMTAITEGAGLHVGRLL